MTQAPVLMTSCPSLAVLWPSLPLQPQGQTVLLTEVDTIPTKRAQCSLLRPHRPVR